MRRKDPNYLFRPVELQSFLKQTITTHLGSAFPPPPMKTDCDSGKTILASEIFPPTLTPICRYCASLMKDEWWEGFWVHDEHERDRTCTEHLPLLCHSLFRLPSSQPATPYSTALPTQGTHRSLPSGESRSGSWQPPTPPHFTLHKASFQV